MEMEMEMATARIVCRKGGGGAVDALDHVVALVSELLDPTRRWTLEKAAARGHARLVRRLLTASHGAPPATPLASTTNTIKIIKQAVEAAAAGGHVHAVEALLTWHPTCQVASAMEDATASGHLAVVQWLHTNAATASQRMTLDAMDSAAVNGHLHVVQWLHAHRAEGCTTRAMDGAARAGRLEVVQWLHHHRHEGGTTQAMDGAAANGHLEVVQWLHHHRREGCSSLAAVAASRNGHARVLAWLERMQTDADKPLRAWHERYAASCPRHHVAVVAPTRAVVRSV